MYLSVSSMSSRPTRDRRALLAPRLPFIGEPGLRFVGTSVRARAAAVRLFAALAFFVIAALVPSRAFATIIPTCEHDAVTRMPSALEPVKLETSCDDAVDAATADGTAAPICDPAGASAIAPPRLLPVSDARIEATPSCGFAFERGPSISPSGDSHPLLMSPAILEQATLAGALVVPPAPFVGHADELAPRGGPRAGVTNDVFHPPR